MKKAIAIILAMAMLCMAGCGGNGIREEVKDYVRDAIKIVDDYLNRKAEKEECGMELARVKMYLYSNILDNYEPPRGLAEEEEKRYMDDRKGDYEKEVEISTKTHDLYMLFMDESDTDSKIREARNQLEQMIK